MSIAKRERVKRERARGAASPAVAEVRRRWRAAYLLSGGVAVLAGVSSIVGLLVDGVYAGPASVAEILRGYDLVTLVVAVPVLLAASWRAARRESARAGLLTAGTLAYLVYGYAVFVFGAAFNDVFLPHIAVLSGSGFALALTVRALDVRAIGAGPRTPRRVAGAILALLAVGLGAMWIYFSVLFALTGEIPAGSAAVEPDAIVHLGIALDLAVLTPVYALAAVLLWRGAAAGYVLASVALVSGTLLQAAYLVTLPLQAAAGVPGAVTFDPFEPAIALLFAASAALLLRHAGATTARAWWPRSASPRSSSSP